MSQPTKQSQLAQPPAQPLVTNIINNNNINNYFI